MGSSSLLDISNLSQSSENGRIYSLSILPETKTHSTNGWCGDVRCEEWALRSDTSTSVLAGLQGTAASWPPKVHHSMALPIPYVTKSYLMSSHYGAAVVPD